MKHASRFAVLAAVTLSLMAGCSTSPRPVVPDPAAWTPPGAMELSFAPRTVVPSAVREATLPTAFRPNREQRRNQLRTY